MRSTLAAITFFLALGVAPLAYAQQSQTPPAAPGNAASNAPTAEDAAAFSDARIAALKEALKLRPDQEKNWAPFESTIRDLAKQRQDRLRKLIAAGVAAQGQPLDPVAVLRQRADAMGQASADLKRFADAVDPLFKSLDDAQKRRMFVLLTDVVPRP
jgi:zinc resistance-associated protein